METSPWLRRSGVAGTYRYYLTRIGPGATVALCHVTQSVLIPALI
jgi:hypothetical protein